MTTTNIPLDIKRMVEDHYKLETLINELYTLGILNSESFEKMNNTVKSLTDDFITLFEREYAKYDPK